MKTLIVDDDPIIRVMLRRFLEPFGECDEATTAPSAVAKFTTALETNLPYNLVCLDVQLPGWSGVKVLRELRTLETVFQVTRRNYSRIVMVTGNSELSVIQLTADLSDAYLLKPVDMSVLYDRLLSLGLIRESAVPDILARELIKACDSDQLSDEELGLLVTRAQASLTRLEQRREEAIVVLSPIELKTSTVCRIETLPAEISAPSTIAPPSQSPLVRAKAQLAKSAGVAASDDEFHRHRLLVPIDDE